VLFYLRNVGGNGKTPSPALRQTALRTGISSPIVIGSWATTGLSRNFSSSGNGLVAIRQEKLGEGRRGRNRI